MFEILTAFKVVRFSTLPLVPATPQRPLTHLLYDGTVDFWFSLAVYLRGPTA